MVRTSVFDSSRAAHGQFGSGHHGIHKIEYDEEKIDEATLALMHLVKHRQMKNGPLRAWKGFDFDVLDRLHEKGFIGNPKSKAKSVVLTEEGVEKSRELFEKMFSTAEDDADEEETNGGELPVDVDEWRDFEWEPPSDEDLETIEVTKVDYGLLVSGLEDDPSISYLDAKTGEVESFLPADAGPVEFGIDDEIVQELREKERTVKTEDRYVVIPEEGTKRAWRDMRDFTGFVTDDGLRERLRRAIDGKGAFGRFRTVLHEHPRVEEAWQEYKRFRRENRVHDHLAFEGFRVLVEGE